MSAEAPNSLPELLQHHDWVVRLARGLVQDADVADDVVQRTWLAVLRQGERTVEAPRAWLASIVRNMVRQLVRERETRANYEGAFEGETEAPSAEKLAEHMELQQQLGRLLLGLDEPYREALLLRFYGGLSSAEISRRTGVVHSTVRWRIQRGLELLRAELDRRSHGDRTQWVTSVLVCARALHRPPAPASVSPLAAGLAVAGVLAAAWIAVRFVVDASDAERALAGPQGRAGVVAASAVAPLPDELTEGRRLVELSPSASPHPARRLDVLVEGAFGGSVAGARVQVVGPDGVARTRALTGATGRATIYCAPDDFGNSPHPFTADKVSVHAIADGYVASAQHHLSWPEGAAHSVRIQVGGPESTLRGRVLDVDSNPISEARIEAGPTVLRQSRKAADHVVTRAIRSGRTNDSGHFVLRNLPPLVRKVRVFAPGFVPVEKNVRPDAGVAETLFQLERAARLEGEVRDPSGMPAAGVRVRFDPPPGDAPWRRVACSTDENGQFAFEAVPVGQVRFEARAPDGRGAASVVLALERGANARWNCRLGELPARAGLDAATCPVRLRVLDPRGLPFETMTLGLTRAGRREAIALLPDRDGGVELALPTGTVELALIAPGSGEWSIGSWFLKANEPSDLGTFQAPAYARIRFEGPWADEAEDCRLEQVLDGDRTVGIDRGDCRMKDAYRVLPGRYRFARVLAGARVAREVRVESGQEAHFDASAAARHVLPIDFRAWAGSSVVLTFASGETSRSFHWQGGDYVRHLRLAPGRYEIAITGDGRARTYELDLAAERCVSLFEPRP